MARKRRTTQKSATPRRPKPVEPISLAGITTTPFAGRRHLVNVDRFAGTPAPEDGVAAFIDSLPGILAGQAFHNLVQHIATARRNRRGVVVAMGAHVIKCGLSTVLIDLMKREIVTGLVLNGAGAIHDYEIALGGRTSEDVADLLDDGSFGMAGETGAALAAAAERGVREGRGLGNALGWHIIEQKCPYRAKSLLAVAAGLNVPATVHVAIGTDTVHMHPNAMGAAMGESSHIDFRIACSVVAGLAGGVWMNVGSAVILPEVFLKAVTVAHNLGHSLDGLVTANLDMIQHYRPQTNVVNRPSAVGLTLVGRHELMLPLLRMALLVALGNEVAPTDEEDEDDAFPAEDDESADDVKPTADTPAEPTDDTDDRKQDDGYPVADADR